MKSSWPPVVSVCMITYNHEMYITQAIEGVLGQNCQFPFELVIGEDCSNDNSRTICANYAEEYPHIIRPLPSDFNIGMMPNFIRTLNSCAGKYIALCEGDDYWTDPHKLQKQVDFLEANPEYVFTFHDCMILNQKTGQQSIRIGDRSIDNDVDLISVILQNNIPTASLLFRNVLDYNTLPDWYMKIKNGDYGLFVLLAERGPGHYIPEPMSVYRVHEGGVWSGSGYESIYRANSEFYGYLLSYFTDQKVKQAIKVKLQYVNFNYGINKIRHGQVLSGLFQAGTNLRLYGDRRLRTKPRKIASAIKTWLQN